VLIDKPGGITSHDAVAKVRRALGTKKVGHAGTLDPMATGLLVMGVGRATRLLRFLRDLPKTYEATTPETLRIAARLGEHPFDHARLVQALYEDNPPTYLTLVGVALGRLEHVAEADLVWTYLTQADLRDAGVHPAETDDLIDVIRTARDVDVAAIVKQQKDGRFKVSVRSRGDHDLARVAAAFGGGGHRLAAGYTSAHGPAETIERLAKALRGELVTA